MTNTQFGFSASLPTPKPYGASVDFVVPTGIDTIATKPGAGGWCTGGNLLVKSAVIGGTYVECSITYAYNISGLARGWYFWFGSSSNPSGAYLSLGTVPVGDSVTLKLNWNGSQWQATLTDHTHSGNNKVAGFGSGTPSQFAINSALVFFENGGDTTCADYNNYYGGEDFKNMKYYDANGNQISFTPSGTSYSQNNPNGCSPPGLLFG